MAALSTWGDSVDFANLEKYDNGDIPDERLVMTTWHDGESLDEVFWFCGHCAHHDAFDLNTTILLHVGKVANEIGMLQKYQAAQQGDSEGVP